MEREFRLRLRLPRSTAQATLVAALLAWPGSVLCPVQQTAVMVGYLADEARPVTTNFLASNQKTVLGASGHVIMVPGDCYPARNTTVYGCGAAPGSPNPTTCGTRVTASPLKMPASGGADYNNSGTGSPSCYNPACNSGSTCTANSAVPLRRVYAVNRAKPVSQADVGSPDILRVDGDIRVNRLCFWDECRTDWPFEFQDCSVGGCTPENSDCMPDGTPPPACQTSGTRGQIRTVTYNWSIPGSTAAAGVDSPWVFRFGIVGNNAGVTGGDSCTGSPVGCEIGFPLPQSSPPAGYSYPSVTSGSRPDSKAAEPSTWQLNTTMTVNQGSGAVTLTIRCRIWYPPSEFSQTKGKCEIIIPIQTVAQSVNTYNFSPTSFCQERYLTSDERYAACPVVVAP
ncbi:MAG: hypothetical protein HY553_17880 [Elusimicrobia bacterium]|nr:hypothetical protein [Elusimicrobiota bacterium]